MSEPHRENRRLWNAWSDAFQAQWNADTAEDDLPPAPSPFGPDAPGGPQPDLVESVAGMDFVELGCGGGQGTVGTARLGAATAVGVDLSSDQLQHARQLRDFYGVDAWFLTGDVTAVPLAADSFDLAASVWALQMVADLEQALREAHRVLRPGGVFVLSVPHQLGECLDMEAETFERGYFDTGRRTVEIDAVDDAELVVFDRTVADLHNALDAAGFDVRRLFECRHHTTREAEPAEADLPNLLWEVPSEVRFWAVAR